MYCMINFIHRDYNIYTAPNIATIAHQIVHQLINTIAKSLTRPRDLLAIKSKLLHSSLKIDCNRKWEKDALNRYCLHYLSKSMANNLTSCRILRVVNLLALHKLPVITQEYLSLRRLFRVVTVCSVAFLVFISSLFLRPCKYAATWATNGEYLTANGKSFPAQILAHWPSIFCTTNTGTLQDVMAAASGVSVATQSKLLLLAGLP